MVFLVNTFGPLLLVLMNRDVGLVAHVPVLLEAMVETAFPGTWATTTFVSQASLSRLHIMVFSMQMLTPCGTDRAVAPLAPVVPSTHHHGST